MIRAIQAGEAGLLVESEPRAMADAIGRLLRDTRFADELSRNAVEHVAKHWSIDASINRLEARLTEVLEGAGAVVDSQMRD